MKRWCICRMGEWLEPGSRGPKLDAHANVSYRIWEHPSLNWCLAHFATDSLATINADAQIKILPDATMDAAWSSLPANVRTAVRTNVEAAGFTWAVNNNWPVRQVLNYLVNQINPAVDVSVGDVKEPG